MAVSEFLYKIPEIVLLYCHYAFILSSVQLSLWNQLSDFGLAVTDGTQNKNSIKLSGTLGYVAPEYLLDGMPTKIVIIAHRSAMSINI